MTRRQVGCLRDWQAGSQAGCTPTDAVGCQTLPRVGDGVSGSVEMMDAKKNDEVKENEKTREQNREGGKEKKGKREREGVRCCSISNVSLFTFVSGKAASPERM